MVKSSFHSDLVSYTVIWEQDFIVHARVHVQSRPVHAITYGISLQ